MKQILLLSKNFIPLILSRNIVFIDQLLPYIGMGNETSRELVHNVVAKISNGKRIINCETKA